MGTNVKYCRNIRDTSTAGPDRSTKQKLAIKAERLACSLRAAGGCERYAESVDSSTAEWSHQTVDQKAARAIREAFGARVRELRRKAGLSQEDLAALADLDRSYIGSVERGERNVSLVNIVKVARGLKMKPSALLDRSRNGED